MNYPLEQTERELALIPKGDPAQNMFRMMFSALRQNSLGRRPEISSDIRAVVEKAKEMVRVHYPAFEPQHDARLLSA